MSVRASENGTAHPLPTVDEPGSSSSPLGAAAFFDMDKTLLRCNTGTEWAKYLRRRGEQPLWKLLRALWWTAGYELSLVDMEAIARVVTGDLRGHVEAELAAKARLFFDEVVVGQVSPRAHEALAFHRAAGRLPVILSGTMPYIADPLALHLGIEHVICTRVRVADGRLTGEHVTPACAGEGKVVWADRFARERGIDLAASWFYTDSFSDLPMLGRVGVPRIVNPDRRLLRHARRVGWSIETW